MPAASPVVKPKYPKHGELRPALVERVDRYFAETGKSRSGGFRLFAKAVVMLTWFWGSYAAMVLAPNLAWASLAAISVGLALAGIGFSVMHDGGHGASSRHTWINRVAARGLDMIGGSSLLWHFKHNIIHHQFPNVEGIDDDIAAEPWLRMGNHTEHRWFHRGQHLYFPLAYSFLSGKWLVFDDFRSMLSGRMGQLEAPKMSKLQAAEILAWKTLTFGWAFVLPTVLHSWVFALVTFAIWSAASGFVMAIVFQLAHCVEEADFTAAPAKGERLPQTWARRQLDTTIDFAPNNPFLTWYLGGLNFQIEHHLFPLVSHVHYPALRPLIKEVCDAHGAPHVTRSFFGALGSHLRHLYRMGHPEPQQPAAPAQPEPLQKLAA